MMQYSKILSLEFFNLLKKVYEVNFSNTIVPFINMLLKVSVVNVVYTYLCDIIIGFMSYLCYCGL